MGKELQQVTLNLLSEGSEFTGDFVAVNDTRVDGVIKGGIKTAGRVVIGSTAKVKGDIEAVGVDVMGTVEGNIVSSGIVTLRESAVFTGTMRAAYVVIENGAIFNGECCIERESFQK